MINTTEAASFYLNWMYLVSSTWLEQMAQTLTTAQLFCPTLFLETTSQKPMNSEKSLLIPDRNEEDIVSLVSHELCTPLTSIRVASEILQDNPDLTAEQREQFVKIIVSESERLSRVVNQLLKTDPIFTQKFLPQTKICV